MAGESTKPTDSNMPVLAVAPMMDRTRDLECQLISVSCRMSGCGVGTCRPIGQQIEVSACEAREYLVIEEVKNPLTAVLNGARKTPAAVGNSARAGGDARGLTWSVYGRRIHAKRRAGKVGPA